MEHNITSAMAIDNSFYLRLRVPNKNCVVGPAEPFNYIKFSNFQLTVANSTTLLTSSSTIEPTSAPTIIPGSMTSNTNSPPITLIVIISVFAFLILLGVGGILMWRARQPDRSSKLKESLLPSVSSNSNNSPTNPSHNSPTVFYQTSLPRSLAETNLRRARSIKIHQYSAADGISNRIIQDSNDLSGKSPHIDQELNTLDDRLFTLARGLSKLDKGLSQLDNNLDKLDKGLGTLERYSVASADGVIKANGVPLYSSLPRSEKSTNEHDDPSTLGMTVVAVFNDKKSLSLGRNGVYRDDKGKGIQEGAKPLSLDKEIQASHSSETVKTTIKRKKVPSKSGDAETIPLRRASLEVKTANIETKAANLQQKALSLDRKALSLNKKAEKMEPITSTVINTDAVIGDVSTVGWLAVEDATEIAKAFRSRLINPPEGWDDSISETSNN
ncbi:hypothetical protein HK103_001723 [Boothiomyces macroporosus]|uniref:Uncharacterized protein n=1 Tax=Boothiomyces macroporosus TaxID=261099 RepID=A0AAD5Y5C8_9FUNG|nr:hypothetical protein HK103_001723 [Boothiomyces macroporosus]